MFSSLITKTCMLLTLLLIASTSFAQGPWIMDWYVLDVIRDTGTHAEGHATDWIELIFGVPESQLAKEGPVVHSTGTLDDEEYGWFESNLEDVNDSHNLSNGIYGGEFGDMSNFVFYGFVAVKSPQAQNTVLNVAQDDEAKIWLNGKFVGESTSWTGGATNTNPFDVHLIGGWNSLMIKVSEEGGGDYLNARFDVDGLEFSANPQIISTDVEPKNKLSTIWGNIKNFE